ncbi:MULTISPECIES: cellulose synthase complex periplasmic endoglucanase BcsZ [Cupriavidus]
MNMDRSRRRWLAGLPALGATAALGALGWPAAAGAAPAACAWPLYQQFVARFVQADGRVLDPATREQHSTSEGQSYGMVFALIANDRATFDRLWQWSIANLGAGSLQDKLPAWQWGRRGDGSWGVIDANAASDADLWFAFALLEAARAWREPRYVRQARALLALAAKQEVVSLPGFGAMLLPAPQGFAEGTEDGPRQWRLNASYLPVPLLRRLAGADPSGPWGALAAQAGKFVEAVARQGIVPDWSAYRADQGGTGFLTDPVKGDVSSYDAIRVYLWAGMTPRGDAAGRALMKALAPQAQRMAGRAAPPERMRADSGALEGDGPTGFSAALVPFLQAAGSPAAAAQRARAETMIGAAAATYYDTVLGLFGLGFAEGRYRFAPSGQLELEWEKTCRTASARP